MFHCTLSYSIMHAHLYSTRYPHPELAVMRRKGVPGFKIQPKYESKRIAPFDVMKEISAHEIT